MVWQRLTEQIASIAMEEQGPTGIQINHTSRVFRETPNQMLSRE
jgi:hypothetical protein